MNNPELELKKAHELWRKGEELKASVILKDICEFYRKNDDKLKLLEILNEYGGALRVIGNLNKSINIFLQAKEVCENIGQRDTIIYATTIMNLANAFRENKEYQRAEKIFEEAKKIYLKHSVKDYSYVGLLNNLSLLKKELGEYNQALELQLEAIEILKQDVKYRVPLAISFNNLYEIEKNLNKISSAQDYLSSAKKILEDEVGKEHPLYAAVLNNLAECNFKIGNIPLALSLYEEALDIVLAKYGKDSVPYKIIYKNIKYIKDKNYNNLNDSFISSQKLSEKTDAFIKANYPYLYDKLCLALVGKGSECYGFDDELSRDHDFSKRCLLLLDDEAYSEYYENLKNDLSKNFSEKIEIYKISYFYKYYTSFEEGPKTLEEYRRVKEEYLSTATNGKVFVDRLGKFTSIRNRLLNYYPEDLRLKFIALTLNKMAQAGQYNFPRLLKRKDFVAANFALNEFIEYFIYFIHLINKKYMPFYKWRFRSCIDLDIFGLYAKEILPKLIAVEYDEKKVLIENICKKIVEYLNYSKLSNINIDFLTYQANEVINKIEDINVKKYDMWER